jgi:hypothetical protein
MTVPLLSRTLRFVRAGYELLDCSMSWYLSSIRPSSAFRPFGTYPAMIEANFYGEIQASPVNACLASRDDPS